MHNADERSMITDEVQAMCADIERFRAEVMGALIHKQHKRIRKMRLLCESADLEREINILEYQIDDLDNYTWEYHNHAEDIIDELE
jgi:hypothetical protein